MNPVEKFERLQNEMVREQQKAYEKVEKIDAKINKVKSDAERKVAALRNERAEALMDANTAIAVTENMLLR